MPTPLDAMPRLARWLLAIVVLLAVVGCGPFASSPPTLAGCPIDAPDTAEIDGVYVLPDDGREPILDEIDAARCTIDVTIYLISDDEVIDALARAEARGVRVRVLLEATPFGGFGQVDTRELLADRGLDVRLAPEQFRFTHAKYLVIDAVVAIVTNQNLTTSAFEGNREVGVVTTDRAVVTYLAGLFAADWEGRPAQVPPERVAVSPIDGREDLLALLGGAERSITLYVEVIRDAAVVAALIDAVERGVGVRLLVNAPDDDLDHEVLGRLHGGGVEIRVAERIYIHAKALVIDGRTALIGSHNPTATSLDDNREVSLIVTEPQGVERAAAVFERDWLQAVPWGPTTGGDPGYWSNRGIALDVPVVYG